MTAEVEQLVRETMELTGAAEPEILHRDAPVLAGDALAGNEPFYLVGFIGGKEVGKSALVNALAGRKITESTSFGPGTENVVAYAHATQEKAVRQLLEREVPGQFTLVTHDVTTLRRQVLLDLPDIDSHFTSHMQVTRKMLRHMLYPVWLVSVEKYADRQPQQMLARVAEGNSPSNFVFCLNKADQLARMSPRASAEDPNPWELDVDPASELRDDYAARVQKSLGLAEPPRVFLISATQPQAFDLPDLRSLLAREKTTQAVRLAQERAIQRQDRSLLSWLDAQQLPARADRLARLEQDARDLVADRVGGPLLGTIIPRLLDDPASRGTMAEEILNERVSGWPLVRLVHTLLAPLFVLLRGATSRTAAPLLPPEGMLDLVLKEAGVSISDRVQTTFAQLRQSEPAVASLYTHRKLWEGMPADASAGELRTILGSTLARQRDAARERLLRGAWTAAPIRWLLTIGAVLWFPFIQPILVSLGPTMNPSGIRWTTVPYLLVQLLGVDYLLKSVGFLVIYFVVLWLALRWNTQRRVNRFVKGWKDAAASDPSLSLTMQTLQWIDGLLSPIRQASGRMRSLAEKLQSVRGTGDRAA